MLDKLAEYPPPPEEKAAKLFVEARARCLRISKVAKAIAEVKAKTLVEDCQAAGILLNVGEMVAILHLGDEFVKVAEANKSRAKILYRLEKDHDFNMEKIGVSYLRRVGVPDLVLYAVDPDMQTNTPGRAVTKPICAAAMEMVVAFDAERWDRIAPDKNLPPKSALRSLGLSDSQYESLYERAGQQLFTTIED